MKENPTHKKIVYKTNPVRGTLRRFITTLFLIVVTLFLIASVFAMINIIAQQSSDSYYDSSMENEIDINPEIQSIIDKLSSSDKNSNGQDLPSGERINPFSE